MNNLSEAFNSPILVARDKPIITMFEWKRRYLMRFASLREKLSKHHGSVMPKPRKRLDREIEKSGNRFPTWTGELKFEVTHVNFVDMFIVDLVARTCSCNFWDLVGIPCRHAVAAIIYNRENPEDYVHSCYKREAYALTYGPTITPINGESMWPQTNNVEILPPQYKRGPGRPKKLRRREPDESQDATRLWRQQTRNKCGTCQEYGHNSQCCQVRKRILRMLREQQQQNGHEAVHNDEQPAPEQLALEVNDALPGFEPHVQQSAPRGGPKRKKTHKNHQPDVLVPHSQHGPVSNSQPQYEIGVISESQPVKQMRKRKSSKGSSSRQPVNDDGVPMIARTVAQLVQDWTNIISATNTITGKMNANKERDGLN